METTGVDPNVAEPVQLSAKILNPFTLECVQNGEFHSFMQPLVKPSLDDENLNWHASKRKITPEEVLDLWYKAPPQKQVWSDFANFTKRFHVDAKRKSIFSAPIRAGANIVNYDNIIFQRLCERHGFIDSKTSTQNLCFPRDNIDIQPMLWFWFEGYKGSPNSLSMDSLRDYFEMPESMAHSADADVDDCITILRGFMKLFRYTSKNLNFAGCFGPNAKINKEKKQNEEA